MIQRAAECRAEFANFSNFNERQSLSCSESALAMGWLCVEHSRRACAPKEVVVVEADGSGRR